MAHEEINTTITLIPIQTVLIPITLSTSRMIKNFYKVTTKMLLWYQRQYYYQWKEET